MSEKAKKEVPETTSQPKSETESWVSINLNRPVYKGDRGKGAPIRGHWLGVQNMPPAGGRAWQAFIVRLTQDCPSCQDRKGNSVIARAGDEILVAANHQLLQVMGTLCRDPKRVVEAEVTPKGTVKTNAGQMVEWDFRINPQPILRSAEDRLIAMSTNAPRQLPAASDASSDDDIPF